MTQDVSFIKQWLSGVTEFVQKKQQRRRTSQQETSGHGVLYMGSNENSIVFNQTYATRMSKLTGSKKTSETASGLVNKVAQTLNAYYTESVFTHDSIEHACW